MGTASILIRTSIHIKSILIKISVTILSSYTRAFDSHKYGEKGGGAGGGLSC